MIPQRAAAMGRALRHRDYRLFFGGQLISLIGTWMQNLAQAWLVFRLSGSAELLGALGFAIQGPIFLLSQLGGAVADQRDRRAILIATQAAAMVLAALLAILTLTGPIRIWEIFLLAGLLGTVNAFDIPARQSFVVELVGREDLPNAIALNSSMFNAARLVGPALAGFAVAAIGEGWCFALNALSFLAVIGSLLAMRRPQPAPRPAPEPLFARVRQGMAHVAGDRPIRTLMTMVAGFSLFGLPYAVLMPIFAARLPGGGAGTLGTLMASAGLGALAGALLLAGRDGIHGMARGVGRAAAAYGLLLTMFAWSRWLWLSVPVLVLIGFCQMTVVASSNTLVQSVVPDAFRGRVMAIFATLFLGMAPFGALLAGSVAARLGASVAVTIGGLISSLVGLWFIRRSAAAGL